jgi:hypothetical protein
MTAAAPVAARAAVRASIGWTRGRGGGGGVSLHAAKKGVERGGKEERGTIE